MENKNNYIIHSRRIITEQWGKLERFIISYPKYKGEWVNHVTRDLYITGETVAIIPYDPDSGKIMLIEQFRTVPLLYNEKPRMIEAIAGIIDEGETPGEAVIRETMEETGQKITNVEHIYSLYTSPGGFGEKIHMFVASTDLTKVKNGVYGMEDEDIYAFVISLKQAYSQLCIIDAKTITMIQWLVLNKSELLDKKGRNKSK